MIALMIMIWVEAGDQLLPAVGTIFQGTGEYEGGPIMAFLAIMGTMIAYFAAVVINFGDFSRFVKSEAHLKKGNWWGLPVNVTVFSFIALFVTAGTVVIFGETLTNPADIVERVGSLPLTIIASICFFAATIGINLVANFVRRWRRCSERTENGVLLRFSTYGPTTYKACLGIPWQRLCSSLTG